MDFSPNETQSAVSGLARKIFKNRCTPENLAEIGRTDDRFDAKLWKELADAGLLGTAIPEDDSGEGLGLLELCALMKEAGWAAAPIPLWPVLALGALPVGEFGTSEQRDRLLPGIGRGQLFVTAALTESGAQPDQPSVVAKPNSSGWTLTGTKICVPAAYLASHILVPARTGDTTVGVFVVDPTADGVTLERQLATTGEPQAQLVMTDAHVSTNDVLGDRADARDIVLWMVARATACLCALELGVCERVLRMTATYTSERVQFDRPIATFQAVGQRAADAYIDVETIRLATWEAVWRLAQGRAATRALAVAKYWAAEAGQRVTYAAQHLHGGIGYDLDYPLARYYTLSKQIELTLGGASEQLARLGAELARD